MISLPPRLATVLIVPLLLAWACGPTGPVAQQTATPAPTAKSDGSDTPIPMGEKEIEAMIRTAIAGAGTREASRNREDTHMPTPPPEAEEPFPPTDTPVPTETPSHPPTPTPNPYAHITIDADLCFNVNLHDPALRRTYEVDDASSYILIRCFDVIGRTIGERCAMNTTNGLDATVRACIKRNAEAVKDYRPRSQLAPECHSIGLTTDDEFFECMRDTSNHDNDLRAALAETKSTIREVSDRNPEVIAAESIAWNCLEQTGKQDLMAGSIDISRLLFWESLVTEADYQRIRDLDETGIEAFGERMRLVDQCALAAGVYRARYDVLMAELRRYAVAEPDKIEPWTTFGTLASLEEYGSAMLRP